MRSDPRERLDRYLPASQRNIALFLDDWEGFVLSCLRRLRVDDEEDVLYRVFNRAVTALPDFRGQSKISTWLYRIAYREGLRHLERKGRLDRWEILSDEERLGADPSEDVERILERIETAQAVRRALSELSPRDREVLALRYLEELKLAELAERLDIPVATAKVRVHRALGRLKNVLEKDCDR